MGTYNSFLFSGHGKNRAGVYDSGALSKCGKHESNVAEKIVSEACNQLKTVNLSIQSGKNNYSDNLTKGNSYSSKAGATVHLNASNGTASGVEILVPCKEKDLTHEIWLASEISKLLNIPNRGIKSRDYDSEKTFARTNGKALSYKDYYREIRQAWENGHSLAIIELCFIDNVEDFKKLNANFEEVSFLVAQYIAKLNNKELIKKAPAEAKQTYYRVVAGSYKEKANADKLVKELKAKGYSPFIVLHEK